MDTTALRRITDENLHSGQTNSQTSRHEAVKSHDDRISTEILIHDLPINDAPPSRPSLLHGTGCHYERRESQMVSVTRARRVCHGWETSKRHQGRPVEHRPRVTTQICIYGPPTLLRPPRKGGPTHYLHLALYAPAHGPHCGVRKRMCRPDERDSLPRRPPASAHFFPWRSFTHPERPQLHVTQRIP